MVNVKEETSGRDPTAIQGSGWLTTAGIHLSPGACPECHPFLGDADSPIELNSRLWTGNHEVCKEGWESLLKLQAKVIWSHQFVGPFGLSLDKHTKTFLLVSKLWKVAGGSSNGTLKVHDSLFKHCRERNEAASRSWFGDVISLLSGKDIRKRRLEKTCNFPVHS